MAKKPIQETIYAKGLEISIYTEDFQNEFISLTDIARYKSDEPKDVIKNWMRSKDTIEFLGLWEQLHNDLFKGALCVIIVVVDRCRNYPESNKRTENDDGLPEKSQRNGDTDDVAA